MIDRGVTTPAPPTPKKKKQDALVGQMLAGKYKILKKIGEGGMGSVYIANQEPIDRKVAIKVLLGKLAEDEIAVKRFEQEAKAISKMQHPNTVTIYDFGHTGDGGEDERLYIVMEYLKGRTLTQVLRSDGQLVAPRAARIIRQVCASLADAHQAGIIHRDLKPDNIFLTEVGEDKDWVKVLDFGVAKLADAEGAGTLTQTGMIFGTPKYMSPEQAEGRPIDYRADIYALGVVLYELLVGRPPFIADTPVGLLLKHISEPPPSFKKVRPDLEIDPRMEAIVMKALEKVPDRRHQMVSDLAMDLEAFERATTGSVQVAAGSSSRVTGAHGMPTEVVPGTLGGNAITPADLMPPNRVPTNLSLGGEQPTAAAAQQRGLTAQQTAPATSIPRSPATMAGITAPVAAPGGVDTLGGGLSHEISGPVVPRPKSTAKLMVMGLGLLASAGALAVFISQQREGQVIEAKEITALPVEDPPPSPIDEPRRDPDPPPPVVADPPPPVAKRPPPDRRRPDPPPPPAPARTITVSFDSNPTKAMVTLNGKQVCMTPCTSKFPKDDDVLTFAFKRDGYKENTKVMTASRDQELAVSLEKEASARPTPIIRKPPPTEQVKPPDEGVDERVDELK
jgi:serine/threonine protein kinase